MLKIMLKSKIHLGTVTETNLYYEGSITLDKELMEKANLLPYEQVEIYNVNNGQRFTTYVIEGKKGSRTICLNGAAARLASPGDRVIIASYAILNENDAKKISPVIVSLNDRNEVI
ncbi:MAG: aspartate 1-decarboxylase [Acidobacteriota bacterium]